MGLTSAESNGLTYAAKSVYTLWHCRRMTENFVVSQNNLINVYSIFTNIILAAFYISTILIFSIEKDK
jgi:hypothetical protein